MTTFSVKAVTKEGFPVEFSGDFNEFTHVTSMLTDPDFGYAPPTVVPPAHSGTTTSAVPGTRGPLSCQFCGKDVKPVKYGNKNFTAEEVAASRAKKMGQMGRGEALPVCGDCWTSGGHNKAWDAYYEAHK